MKGLAVYLCEEYRKIEKELEQYLALSHKKEYKSDSKPFELPSSKEACWEAVRKKGDSRIDQLINKMLYLSFYDCSYSPVIAMQHNDLDYLYNETAVYDYDFNTDCRTEGKRFSLLLQEMKKEDAILLKCTRVFVFFIVHESCKLSLEEIDRVVGKLYERHEAVFFCFSKGHGEKVVGPRLLLIGSY